MQSLEGQKCLKMVPFNHMKTNLLSLFKSILSFVLQVFLNLCPKTFHFTSLVLVTEDTAPETLIRFITN